MTCHKSSFFSVIVFFIGTFPYIGLSQEYIGYYKTINEAEVEVANKQYLNAMHLYDSAFKMNRPFARDAFNAAIIADICNRTSIVNAYLQISINNGLDSMQILNSSLKEYYTPNLMQSSSINYRLRSFIDSLYILDQKIRSSPKFDRKTDQWIQDTLSNIIIKKNMIDERSVGCTYQVDKLKLLLSHGMLLKNDSLNNILLSAVLHGKIHPQNYASLIDYMTFIRSSIQKKPQFYFYISKDINTAKTNKYKVRYPKAINKNYKTIGIIEINKRRESIGLPSIEDGAKVFKMKTKYNMLFNI